MEHENTLTILTTQPVNTGMRGIDDQVRKVTEKVVSADVLQHKFIDFIDSLQNIFLTSGKLSVGDFVLDEITFSAEIGVEGEFKLVGTGMGVSANSGITFTLRHQDSLKS